MLLCSMINIRARANAASAATDVETYMVAIPRIMPTGNALTLITSGPTGDTHEIN